MLRAGDCRHIADEIPEKTLHINCEVSLFKEIFSLNIITPDISRSGLVQRTSYTSTAFSFMVVRSHYGRAV